jgi:hypothetical protein
MGYILYLALLLFVVIGVLIFTILYFTDNRDKLGGINKELNSIDTNTEKLNSIDTNTEETNNKLTQINNNLGVSGSVGKPYDLSVSEGNVSRTETLFKFGFNPDINGTEETIWNQGGNIPWLGVATTVYVSSTDVNDSAAGTGGQAVEVQGLDGDYNLLFGVASLSGQTQVKIVNKTGGGPITFLRVFRAFITSSGSNGKPFGIIYLGPTGSTLGVPTTVYANFGDSAQTQIAAYTVPAGKTLYLDDLNFTAAISQANDYATVKLRTRHFGTNTWRVRFINVLQSNQLITKFEYPRAFPEKTDLECRALTSGTNNQIAASFQGILVDNS